MASSQWLSIAALCVILCGGVHTFKPFTIYRSEISHGDITEMAILRKTAEVCRDLAQKEGRPFSLTIDNRLSASAVLAACSPDSDPSLLSSTKFKAAIVMVYLSNDFVDISHSSDPKYHFDDETFVEGRSLITQGRTVIKKSVTEESFLSARGTLGKICHTLQDFYSHSNWIELENKAPFSTLIKPDVPFTNFADKNTATCTDCVNGNCENNILPEILLAKMLTSGYFDMFSSKKPPGKCSHGGFSDRTSRQKPVGGISKDATDSDHGKRHVDAANMAVNATMELLEDIRGAVGDIDFLRLMGITHSSVLAFVIDTTGSMFDDIDEAKRVAYSIIDRKQASAYILVPFNDPEFGPLTRTTDAALFKQRIAALGANGGGDEPEMCLSGLQLALTGAPPFSEIFVFTDASAKDMNLKSTVLSLMESTKSVVNFMLTKVISGRRRRSSDSNNQMQQQRLSSRLSSSASQEYQELAQASGGLAIQASKANLPQATSIILDSTTSTLVTLSQAVRNPGKDEDFIFMVDPSIRNMTAYITGNSVTYSLQNPLGVQQSSAEPNGPLGSIQVVGNLNRIQLNQQEGLWKIHISSTQPYQLKVTGQSTIDFIFTFFNILMDPQKGMELNEGRPKVGTNTTLFLTVTSNTPVNVTEVLLVEASGAGQMNGTLQDLGHGNYLMTVDKMPEGVFNVRVTGMSASSSRSSNTLFQRQSNTQIKASNLIVSVQDILNLEPGVPISIPFTVKSPGSDAIYLISVRDDKNFIQSFTEMLLLVNGSAQGSVNLTAPRDTLSGTDVTVTITADSSDHSDSNYAVARLSVVAKVTDISPPVCQGNTTGNCSGTCSLSSWELSANVTDGNGTGVTSVSARGGNGTLNSTTSVGEGGINVTQVFYSASCCAPELELVVVDAVGNVGRCIYSVRDSSPVVTPSPVVAPSPTTPPTVPVTPSKGAASLAPCLSVWTSLLIILKAFIAM